MRNTTFRVILCVCLMAVAVTMAAFTLAGFRKPLRVTDIELASLRATDRALVEHGIPVASREALQALLEDLGS